MQKEPEITTPELDQVYFYLTGGCNLRCRHCWITPRFAETGQKASPLDPALFHSVIQQAKPLGLTGIKLTGGEPLLHPDIDELLSFVQSENINLVIETNGVLCTPQLSKAIAACKNAFVSVSLDAADAKIHDWIRGVEGAFDKTITGIKNLVDADIPPQIIMSVMQVNREQIEPVVSLAEKLGADSVKFNIVEPTARGQKMHEARETLTVKELVAMGEWVENTLSADVKVPLLFDHPHAFRPLGKMFGEKGDGCSACGILDILGVLSDGSYALCGIGENVPELVFGHAATNRLADIWKHTPVLNELRSGLTYRFEGICGDCLMRDLCLGSCIAQNYYRNKNLWAPFWFCAEAEKTGLFPDSRRKSTNLPK